MEIINKYASSEFVEFCRFDCRVESMEVVNGELFVLTEDGILWLVDEHGDKTKISEEVRH